MQYRWHLLSSTAVALRIKQTLYMQANPGEAMRNFEVAAGQGDAFAAFNLGYMYLKGVGTAPNFTAAEHHFKEAASQGVGSAYNGLGVLHFGGQTERGVDYAAARRAFQKGVALGDSDSMFNLAIIYGGEYLQLGAKVL